MGLYGMHMRFEGHDLHVLSQSRERFNLLASFERPDVEIQRRRDIEVLDLLEELVEQSLLIIESRRDGATRLRMLETIRAYALEHLDELGALAARRNDALHEVQAGLEGGARSLIFPADVTDRARVGSLISRT